jgi:hypothetical protein
VKSGENTGDVMMIIARAGVDDYGGRFAGPLFYVAIRGDEV